MKHIGVFIMVAIATGATFNLGAKIISINLYGRPSSEASQESQKYLYPRLLAVQPLTLQVDDALTIEDFLPIVQTQVSHALGNYGGQIVKLETEFRDNDTKKLLTIDLIDHDIQLLPDEVNQTSLHAFGIFNGTRMQFHIN